MIGLLIISWIGPLASVWLLYALYRKAGLRGGVMMITFLPVLGLVLSTLITLGLGSFGFGDQIIFHSVSTLLLVALHLAPLVVLLMKDWPGRDSEDVCR